MLIYNAAKVKPATLSYQVVCGVRVHYGFPQECLKMELKGRVHIGKFNCTDGVIPQK